MKLGFTLMCCVVGISSAFAQTKDLNQKQELPFDERGKLIYYEVVDQNNKTKDQLKGIAKAYFQNQIPKIMLSEQDTLLNGKGKLIINKTAFVLTRPSGEVHYQLYLDFKPGKYRYWLTDFVFIPYQRDRYGNFVPATAIGTPLEQKPGKLNAAEWESYLKATAQEAYLFAEKFKTAMADMAITIPAAKAVPVQTTRNQKW